MSSRPLVYLDTCVLLKVVKSEREEWVDACLAVLQAFDRREIRIAASTLLLAELNGYRRRRSH